MSAENKTADIKTARELQEELEGLKKENAWLKERLDVVIGAAIDREELAVTIAGNSSMRLVRQALKKAGKGDPFEQLRPCLSMVQSQIMFNLDSISYRRGYMIIRGWALDLDNRRLPRILLRDRRNLVPFVLHTYAREDVNDEFKLPTGTVGGFSLRISVDKIQHHAVTLEFENEKGYTAREIEVLLTEEERQAFIENNTHPIYAEDNAGYDDWLAEHRASDKELERQSREAFAYAPKISICIPLYNTKEDFLKELMDSLLGQSYKNFEICLADGSTSDKPGLCLKEHYDDPRVIYQRLKENKGISGNTNAAFDMATGDFIMLCDHDDTLEKDALYEMVKAINENPGTDVIYTDEDKLMLSQGVYYSPNFKPDYSPDLLRTNNYITHIFCVKKTILDVVGGEDSAYDGAQDYDFILRCCEQAQRIVHVPKMLYHWRAHEESTAGNPESKMYAYDAGRRAVQAHYDRVGIPARVVEAEDVGSYRSVYEIQGDPKVSIIIPNKDMKDVLKRCLDSIFEKSTYKNYEIVIAENNSETEEIFDYYKELEAGHDNVKILRWDKAFNYSAINNFAAAQASGDYLLFLNNDTEVITDRWIEEMLGYCQREDVGICGARLYYPDDRLQHCGVVVGIGGLAGHICHLKKRGAGGYFGRIVKSQDVSAVTAACMMMPRRVFEEVGGFDEAYAVAYNDVDLCLKVRDKGYLVVYNAWCLLYHYESLSRGSDEEAVDQAKHARQMKEGARLREKWPDIFKNGDPYFNANLDYDTSDYVLRGTIPKGYSSLQAIREEGEKTGDRQ